MPQEKAPQSSPGLTPPVFHILLALADGERHGYAIGQDVAVQTDGRLDLGPGTLYGCLKRMLAAALVEESDVRRAGRGSSAGCGSDRWRHLAGPRCDAITSSLRDDDPPTRGRPFSRIAMGARPTATPGLFERAHKLRLARTQAVISACPARSTRFASILGVRRRWSGMIL